MHQSDHSSNFRSMNSGPKGSTFSALTCGTWMSNTWEREYAARLRRMRCVFGTVVALLAMPPCVSRASTWPMKPVTIVVPFVAGGNTDMMARLAADRLAAKFGHPFVIENRGGAGGVTAAGQVARAAPDGYTFLFGAGSQLTLAPLLQKVSYDPDKDLIPGDGVWNRAADSRRQGRYAGQHTAGIH